MKNLKLEGAFDDGRVSLKDVEMFKSQGCGVCEAVFEGLFACAGCLRRSGILRVVLAASCGKFELQIQNKAYR